MKLSSLAVAFVLAAVSVATGCASEASDVPGSDGLGADERVGQTSQALSTDAPTGFTNVAYKHPVTTSQQILVGDPNAVVDGTLTSPNTVVMGISANQWFTVDLSYDRAIEYVDVFSFFSPATYASNVELLDANDKVVKTISLKTVSHDDATNLQRLTISPAVTARKIRVVDPAFGGLSLVELRAYARVIPQNLWNYKPASSTSPFCWKNTQGRGAGTVPTTCPAGTEKNGALCYPTCAAGYTGNGPVCWSSCPSGYVDTGALCQRNVKIISADNSSCPGYDKCGLTFAKGCSVCPAGYHNDGCTCRIDAKTIAKDTYTRGAGKVPGCAAGKQEQAGLCYNACLPGSTGVGPVCWSQCSGDHPTDCMLGCSTTADACVKYTTDLTGKVAQMVISISGLAEGFAETGEAFSLVNEAADFSESEIKALKTKVYTLLEEQMQDATVDELNNITGTIVDGYTSGGIDWTQLDPTGIAPVIVALIQPMC